MKRGATLVLLSATAMVAVMADRAAGGYDIAHIIERSCEPGGPLVVADKWKSARAPDAELTEPGEVIACPDGPTGGLLQIAAGPERIGRSRFLCSYFSHRSGAGMDLCTPPAYKPGGRAAVSPMIIVRPSSGSRLALFGTASAAVADVTARAGDGARRPATLTWIDADRAVALGGRHPFSYFALSAPIRAVCAGELRVTGHDTAGRRVIAARIERGVHVLDAGDRRSPIKGIRGLCRVSLPKDDGVNPFVSVGRVLVDLFELIAAEGA